MTERLARACAAHPWRTICIWLVAVVLGVAGAAAGLGSLSTEGEVTNNPDSLKAKHLIEQRVPDRQTATEIVVVRSDRLTVDQPGFRAEVGRLANVARGTGEVAGAAVYYQRPDPIPGSPRHDDPDPAARRVRGRRRQARHGGQGGGRGQRLRRDDDREMDALARPERALSERPEIG